MMLELLIEKIKQENQELQNALKKINDNNFVYTTVSKILNDLDISEDDINRVLTIINQDQLIKGVEKETLDFILLVLLPNKIKLEPNQKEILNRLLKLYVKQTDNNIIDKISKNDLLIVNLESEEIFIYFDELNFVLNRFNYNHKDSSIIIKELITRNYHVNLESKVENESVISRNKESCDIASISSLEEENQSASDIKISEQVKIVSDIIEEKEPVTLNQTAKDFFKKYNLYYSKLDDNLKVKINNYVVNIKEAEYLMIFFKKLHIDFKSFYNKDCKSFVHLILHVKLEYINEIIDIAVKRKINLNYLICRDYRILYSKQFDGHFENFVANIDYLDSLNYDYSNNEDVSLYCVNNKNLKSSYKLYTYTYKLQLVNIQNISFLALLEWQAILDQLIEISRNAMYAVEQTNMEIFALYDPILFYILKSLDYQVRAEYSIPDLISLITSRFDTKGILAFRDSKKEEMNSYKVEKTVFEQELDKFFLHAINGMQEELWIIPHNVQIVPEIFENEHVSYLESNYRSKEYTYLINKTRVSRIKTLRILSHLLNHDIEITQDVVKYALKFNYIFTQNDLENINSVFMRKKKIKK